MRKRKKNIKEIWDTYTEGWFGAIVYVVLGFLIAFFLNTALGIALQTDTPVVAVFSNSMVPTYYKGDLIFVQHADEVSAGDIIVFDAPAYRYPIIHRVISIEEGVITTKGDNNVNPDPWKTTVDEIHGKSVLRVPFLGWVKVGLFEILGLA
ncbi:MAG: signal peptidase I [Candidatus Aenigmatarchaeota archaeon]